MTRTFQVEVRRPRMGWAIALSVLVIMIGFTAAAAYNTVAGPIEAQIAPSQLDGSSIENIQSRALAQWDIPGTIRTGTLAIAGLFWIPVGIGWIRYLSAKPEGNGS